MDNMLNNLTVRDFLGPISQFITNLLGKNGMQWWEDFKKMLRKELVTFTHDMRFDFVHLPKNRQPQFITLSTLSNIIGRRHLSRGDVFHSIRSKGLRMGTTEELISFLSLKVSAGVSEDEMSHATVLVNYGLNQTPCAVCFSRKGNSFQMRVIEGDTVSWGPESRFLVFPYAW